MKGCTKVLPRAIASTIRTVVEATKASWAAVVAAARAARAAAWAANSEGKVGIRIRLVKIMD
jgi:hypothetical protein